MVRTRLAEPDASKGFILDGFPRTAAQAETLSAVLEEQGTALDAVVQFVVPDDVVVGRLLGRGRSDDTENVIRNRLKVYQDETVPLLAFYRDRLVRVDAGGEVEEVVNRVTDAVGTR
jgi:adenylate kinase